MQSLSLRDLKLSSKESKSLLSYLHEKEVLKAIKTCLKITIKCSYFIKTCKKG